MKEDLTIKGDKITIRDWSYDDLARFRVFMLPGHPWQELDGPYYPKPAVEAVDALIERMKGRIEHHDWPTPRLNLPVVCNATGQLVGRVSWYWQSKETHWLSVGVVIYDDKLWRRGLGYEALGLWGQYLLDTMPELIRLDLRTWSGNLGMMRLALKLGYQREAVFRSARIVHGKYYDSVGYGVLRDEWDHLYPQGFGKTFAG